MVVGCGALGSEVVRLLALVGVGRIVVVDADRVELHNLTRGVFFRAGDVGRSKAAVTAQRARALNPDVRVEHVTGYVETHVGLNTLREMDVLACCVDSIGARVAVSRMCYRAGVPWVNGGISPTAGEVAAFGAASPPCYVCTVSEEMWEREQLAHTCRGFRAVGAEKPVATTATAASVVAAFQVQQILLRLSSSKSAPACLNDGEKAFISLSPPNFMITQIVPDPECDSHDTWYPLIELPGSPRRITVRDVLQAAGCPDGTLHFGREIVLAIRYPCCRRTRRVGKPLRLCTEALLRCPQCNQTSGEGVVITEIGGTDARANRPLADFGIPPRDILKVRDSCGASHYVALT